MMFFDPWPWNMFFVTLSQSEFSMPLPNEISSDLMRKVWPTVFGVEKSESGISFWNLFEFFEIHFLPQNAFFEKNFPAKFDQRFLGSRNLNLILAFRSFLWNFLRLAFFDCKTFLNGKVFPHKVGSRIIGVEESESDISFLKFLHEIFWDWCFYEI